MTQLNWLNQRECNKVTIGKDTGQEKSESWDIIITTKVNGQRKMSGKGSLDRTVVVRCGMQPTFVTFVPPQSLISHWGFSSAELSWRPEEKASQ